MIFVIIIGGGAFRTIELPVTNALLIDTVPRERLTNAVAMLGFGQNLTQFVGPIAAGFLYTPLTPAGPVCVHRRAVRGWRRNGPDGADTQPDRGRHHAASGDYRRRGRAAPRLAA